MVTFIFSMEAAILAEESALICSANFLSVMVEASMRLVSSFSRLMISVCNPFASLTPLMLLLYR